MVAVFVIFALVPIGWIVRTSFTRFDGFTAPEWIGLQNYATLLGDSAWWRAVLNTFVLAVGAVIIQVPLALMLALVLNRRFRLSVLFRTVYFVPYITSLAVMGIVFFFLLRPRGGILNAILIGIGLIDQPVDFLGTTGGAMWSLIGLEVWSSFGFSTVLFLAGLQTVPGEVLEAAAVDGAGEVGRFRYITLPLLAPVVTIVVLLAAVSALRSFDIVRTLTAGGPAGTTNVMFTYMFEYFFAHGRGTQLGYGSALAVGATLIVSTLAAVYFWIRGLVARRYD